jgi:hypothetical protein
MSVRRLERKLGRAVSWEPTHDVFFRFADMLSTSRRVPPLYVAQAALRSVELSLRAGGSPIPFGLLAGNLCVCPRTSQDYLLIDEVIPARLDPGVAHDPDDLIREMRGAARAAASRGQLAIGWYQGDADVLELVAREDVALHCAMFPEPWQVMLLRDGVDGLRHGSFVRIEPADKRPYAIRFFELQEETAFSQNRALRTVVRWENYQTSEVVAFIDERERRIIAPRHSESLLDRLRARWTTQRDGIPRPNGVRHYFNELRPLGDRDSSESAHLRPMKPADLPTPPATPSVPDPSSDGRAEPPASLKPELASGRQPVSTPESISDFINYLRDRHEIRATPEAASQVSPEGMPVVPDESSRDSKIQTNGALRPQIRRDRPAAGPPEISPTFRSEAGGALRSESAPDARPESQPDPRPEGRRGKRQEVPGDSRQDTPRSPISVPRVSRETSSPLRLLKKMLRVARREPKVVDGPATADQSAHDANSPTLGMARLADLLQPPSLRDGPSSGSHPLTPTETGDSNGVEAHALPPAAATPNDNPPVAAPPRPASALASASLASLDRVAPVAATSAAPAAGSPEQTEGPDVAERLLADLMKSLSMPTVSTELPDYLQPPRRGDSRGTIADVPPSVPPAGPPTAPLSNTGVADSGVIDSQKSAIETYRNSVVTGTPAPLDAVEVPKAPPPVEIRLAADRTTLNSGESIQLLPSVIDAAGNVITNVPVTFSSSDPGIVTIWSTGTATSVGPAGTVEVTIRAANLARVVRLTVLAETTFLDVRPNPLRLQQLGSRQLDVRALEASGVSLGTATFTYSSSDPSVVSVTATGFVRSVGPAGVASITVQSDRVVVVVQVMVVHVPTRIAVTPNPTRVAMGRRRRLTSRMLDAVGDAMNSPPIEYWSSNPALVEIAADGVMTAKAERGRVTITVRARGTKVVETVPVEVVSVDALAQRPPV